jgi:glycosyltransferase involved in cell wall biosynthesis
VARSARLTIGLPVYNGAGYIGQSLDALLGQTFQDYEIIISDNASTDDTPDICRRYEREDSRIRFVRQARNIGAAPNHNFVVGQARADLFKWASADDLYARDLLERCIEILDERPEVVLAHSWTAAVDASGAVTQALAYHLATDSPRASERFRSMLFQSSAEDPYGRRAGDDYGLIGADDMYGVIRMEVLRRVAPLDSYHFSDRTFMTEIALHGPFQQIPHWLYFRRDHAERAQHAHPTLRKRCANMDPRRANRWVHPVPRLLAEYIGGFIGGIRRAPLSSAERRECYWYLSHWVAAKTLPRLGRSLRPGYQRTPVAIPAPPPDLRVDQVVAGRGQGGT